MVHTTYSALSLESLHELLTISVRDMLIAFDTENDNLIAFRATKKQVELLLTAIEKKKKEEIQTISSSL